MAPKVGFKEQTYEYKKPNNGETAVETAQPNSIILFRSLRFNLSQNPAQRM